METKTIDTNNQVALSEHVFGHEYNPSIVHQAVVTYMNNARSGNSAQKTRSEVRGGGKKPWGQKGTGRARAGTIRSPLWRSGGVTFASKKRDYSQKLNKKMYRKALMVILSELLRNNALSVVESFECPTPKTKDFLNKMKELNLNNALIILDEINENEYLASRNVPDFNICDAFALDPYTLLYHTHVVVTRSAMQRIEEYLA